MEGSRGLTVTLDSDVAEKLYKLAGGSEDMMSFLAEAIARLYEKQQLLGGDATLDRLIYLAESREEQIHTYKENVMALQRQLRKMTMSQEELMATLDHLHSATSDIRKSTRSPLLQ